MKYSATPESEVAEYSGADRTASAACTAVVKSAGEARPPGIAEYCATTKSELAESLDGVSSDEAGQSCSRAEIEGDFMAF